MLKKRLGKRSLFSGCLFLAICCWASLAMATTLNPGDFTCALCGQKFSDQILGSCSTGGRDSEFRSRYLGMSPWPYFVHTCPHCHFTNNSHKANFSEPEKKNIQKYLKEYCRKHNCSQLDLSQKYEILAHTQELRGLPPLKVADAYLKAAWMADDEKNRIAAQRFRQQAIRRFARVLEGREVKEDLLPNLTYLVGELHRRTGNFTEALQWFARVQAPQPWLAALVKQQRELAAQHNADRAGMPSHD